MLKIFRTDYHFCKVNFEKEYDQVINAVIFQFLLKLEPKLNQFFSPPCILNFIRAVANLLNQELWKVTKGFVIMDEEAILKFNDDRVKRKETNFRNKKTILLNSEVAQIIKSGVSKFRYSKEGKKSVEKVFFIFH